ncbi:hypothetical protein [Sphingorhabdus sp. YGSMI21]|uniref:hypothetical protein n=1 Tax=Sphingorhabdus sp. YGSMI21 TaxID=2077182 RepID=UPI000C1F201E|nr:hypothetical protein [Sphingorhabdus sp. YGSMI21]ATW05500.1 hypothetical protein CHN51_10475 [Sphingorhabdus sp. YGSMI21]
MNSKASAIVDRIRELEAELEVRVAEERAEMGERLDKGRAELDRDLEAMHRSLRVGVLRYISEAQISVILTAPFIYALLLPFAFLDLSVSIYQAVCFRAYGIERVRRRDYIVYDRGKLSYLNAIEKINCTYCSYANGVIAYVREVAGRTEQYWCPIKHALKVRGQHKRQRLFEEYGDGADYQKRLAKHRAALKTDEKAERRDKDPGL